MPNCSKCGAPITFAVRLKTGSRIPLVPLDERFPAAPKYRITAIRSDGQRECERDDSGEFISHFSNCPNAKDFSGRKRR